MALLVLSTLVAIYQSHFTQRVAYYGILPAALPHLFIFLELALDFGRGLSFSCRLELWILDVSTLHARLQDVWAPLSCRCDRAVSASKHEVGLRNFSTSLSLNTVGVVFEVRFLRNLSPALKLILLTFNPFS